MWRISDGKDFGEFGGTYQQIDSSKIRLTTRVDRRSQLEKLSVEKVDGTRIALSLLYEPSDEIDSIISHQMELIKLLSSSDDPEVKIRVLNKDADGRAVAEVINGDAGTVRLGDLFFVGDPARIANLQRKRWALATWDLPSGKQINQEILTSNPSGTTSPRLPKEFEFDSKTFSADGRRVVTWGGEEDARLAIWDSATGELLHNLTGTSLNVFSVAVSSDAILALGEWDGWVKIWNLSAGQPISEFRAGSRRPIAAISPDGQTLAACGYTQNGKWGSNEVTLWDMRSREKKSKVFRS